MKEIATALNKFQADLPQVNLDATVKVTLKSGGSYNFKYATLAHIIKTVLPSLVKNGMSFSQTFSDGSLCTTLYHVSGEQINSHIPLNMDGGTMQEIGSRISYLKRYSLTALLGIVGEEDDDANIADGNTYQKKQPQPKKESNKMTKDDWNAIQGIGYNLSLTDAETKDVVKWKCANENINVSDTKVLEYFTPYAKFDKTLAEYSAFKMEEK